MLSNITCTFPGMGKTTAYDIWVSVISGMAAAGPLVWRELPQATGLPD